MWKRFPPLVAFAILLVIGALVYFLMPSEISFENINVEEPTKNEIQEIPEEKANICLNTIPVKYRSKGERICCETMSEIYGKPFVTVRPDWLKNPETKRNLELDCYNEELGIAVEYNGIQHYQYPNPFSKNEEDFIKQVRRDLLKEELCQLHKIDLITVPYDIPHSEIPAYLRTEIKNLKFRK